MVHPGKLLSFHKFQEIGSATIDATTLQASVSGGVTAVNLFAEGDDVYNRSGRTVEMLRVKMRYAAAMQAPGTNIAPGYVRVMLVWDNFPNQLTTSLPTIAQVLTTSSVPLQVISFPLYGNTERFEVLYDRVHSCGNYIASSTIAETEVFHGSADIDLSKRFSFYYNSGASYSDLNTGGLLLVAVGSQTDGVGYNLGYSTRCTFIG